jgi:hypothetical protein
MAWILWLVGLVVIALTALAATGTFGSMADENELIPQQPVDPTRLSEVTIPLSFIGYRRDVVDSLLEDLQNQIEQLQPK